MQKLKSMPTSYWVVGLGAAALGVDYLVEGRSSIVSSIWHGVTGGREEPAGKRLPAPPSAPTTPQVVTRPSMLPSAAVPGLEYMVVPYFHRPRRYYPAHESLSAWARYARGREHERRGAFGPEARWPHGRRPPGADPYAYGGHPHARGALEQHPGFRTGHFDWEE